VVWVVCVTLGEDDRVVEMDGKNGVFVVVAASVIDLVVDLVL
jgi:hypothetical protein